jgi:hypothetical protein
VCYGIFFFYKDLRQFWTFVAKIINTSSTSNFQLADIFTKPLSDEMFHRHLPAILGGESSGDLQVYLRAKDDYNKMIILLFQPRA